MSKRYTSTITVTSEGNMLDAKNMKEYIEQLKQGFLEEFGISLNDTDINNVKEIPFTRLSKTFKEELKKWIIVFISWPVCFLYPVLVYYQARLMITVYYLEQLW